MYPYANVIKTKDNRISYSLKFGNKVNKNIQILFVTRTPLYIDIIKSAAQNCKMPFINQKWRNGLISTNTVHLEKWKIWCNMVSTSPNSNILVSKYRSLLSKDKNLSRKKKQMLKEPVVIIIPDTNNNEIIIKETHQACIPIIGLIDNNSSCNVDYPVFGNTQSIHVVYFFCHFVARIIVQELRNYSNNYITNNKLNQEKAKKKKFMEKIRLVRIKPKRHVFILNKKRKFWLKKKKKKAKPFFVNYFAFNKTIFFAEKEKYHLLDEIGQKLRNIISLSKKLTLLQMLNFLKKYPNIFSTGYDTYMAKKQAIDWKKNVLVKSTRNIGSKNIFRLRNKNRNIYDILSNSLRGKQQLWLQWFGKKSKRKYFWGKNNKYYWRSITCKQAVRLLRRKHFLSMLNNRLKYNTKRYIPQFDGKFWVYIWKKYRYFKRKKGRRNLYRKRRKH